MGRFLFKVGIFLWNHFVPSLRQVDYFEKRYGIGSWVVVTGATGSIGSAFCSFFADRSFNLVLIGRSLEGLEAKSKELKDEYPTVMTKLVVTDFQRSSEEGWIDNVFEQLQGMSISVLVNASDRSEMINATNTETQVESIRRTLIVNDFPVVLLTTKILPRLADRYEKLKLRGAIITVSSDAGKRIFPGFTIFGASMALANYFTVAAGVEFQRAVDSLCINLVGSNRGGRNDPYFYVSSSMRQLGRSRETSGWWFHCLQHSLLSLIPSEVLYFFWQRIVRIKILSQDD